MKQIVVQPQAVGFCRFHQRIDDCTRLHTLGCIGKEPSLPADNKRADGVFNLVVADFNLTMLKKRAEVCLLILSIRNSVLQLACRTENRIQPFPVRFENRSRLLLALDEAFFCGQFFKLVFQLKQPVAERIALRSLTGLCIGAFGSRLQPLPAHVRPASRTLCVLNLVVAAVSIRNQDAAEALKEIPRPFSASALPIFEAA